MTDQTSEFNDFTRNLRIEKLLDEFESLCRKGNATAIEYFLKQHHGERSEVRQEFSRIAHQYELALATIDGVISPRENLAMGETIGITGLPARSTRFIILRPHARGGLGQVSVALDSELNRQVALKEILPNHADDQTRRQRFLQEAEITGQLEHPGIVPVYGLGASSDGRPYYAMRFVEGDSLKTVIAELHRDAPRGANLVRGKHVVQFRHLLGNFVAICHAIHYAHSRQVLHRDLKPDNIMLGPYGETLVVDWGLAKPLHKLNSDSGEMATASGSGSGSQPVRLKSRDSHGETLEGSAVGTPAYMSPEQAQGKLSELGPASDIYSLGATLYAILTGHAPFKQEDAFAILKAVREGDFPKPRQLNPSTPKAIEAICAKAMARKTTERYSTARELAEDVERFLADEPVSALPESSWTRMGRWTRRNRGVVMYATASLLAITSVSIFFAVSNNRLRREAQAQEQIAIGERNKARLLADENLRIAESNRILAKSEQKKSKEATQLAEEKQALADTEREQRITSEKLAEFLTGLFYAADPVGMNVDFFIPKANSEKLTADEILSRGAKRLGEDQSLAKSPLAKAQIMHAIGDVNRQLGRFAESESLLTESLEIRKKLLGDQHALTAESLHALGQYYHERGDFNRADPLYRQAIAIREKLPGEEGKKARAASLHNLAWMIANDGDAIEAEKLFRQVLELKREIYGDVHRETAFSKMGIAFSLIEQHRMPEVLPIVISFKNDLQKLEGSGDLVDGVTSFAMALATQEIGGSAAAEGGFRAALASVSKGLGEDNVYTGLIHCELGTCLQEQKKYADAEVHFRKSFEIANDKVQLQHPRIRLLIERFTRLLRITGKTDEAVTVWEKFLTAQKKRFETHRYVAEATYEFADFLRDAHRYEQSTLEYKRFLELASTLRKGGDFSVDLAHFWIGRNLLDQPDPDAVAAEAALTASLNSLKADPPPGKDLASEEAFTRIYLAQAMIKQNRTTDAEQVLRQADENAKSIVLPKSQVDFRERFLETRVLLHQQNKEPAKIVGEYEFWLKENEPKLPASDESLLKIKDSLAQFYENRGDLPPAIELRKAALSGRESRLPAGDSALIASRNRLSRTLLKAGQFEAAAEQLKAVLKHRQAKEPNLWTTFNTQSMLGEALLGMNQLTEAEPLLRDAWKGFETHVNEVPPDSVFRIDEALSRLIKLEETLGRPEDAAKWKKMLEERKLKPATSP